MSSDHDAAAAVGSESRNKTAKSDVMKRLGQTSASTSNATGNGSSINGEGANVNANADAPFKLAPFNPSSDQIQEKALGMLDLGKDDVLFDLGCGDGRLLCFAASQIPGLRCVGIEIEAEYVRRGKDRVSDQGLGARIDIRLEDATKAGDVRLLEDEEAIATTTAAAMESNSNSKPKPTPNSTPPVQTLTLMDDATALYLFILPKGIVKMMPILESLKQKRSAEGKRLQVLSYMFKIHDWEATIVDETAKGSCPVYYYDFE